MDCPDVQLYAEVSAPSALPSRPLWADDVGLHVVHLDRDLGIMHWTFSRDTGREVASHSEQVFPTTVPFAYWGVDAVAADPQGDLAVAFAHMDAGIRYDGVLSLVGDSEIVWTPPWKEPSHVWELGWDGDGFTASLFDSGTKWAAARFSSA